MKCPVLFFVQVEQFTFPTNSAAETAQGSVFPQNPVTWNQNRDWIPVQCISHRTCRFRKSAPSRQFAITNSFPGRHISQCLINAPIKSTELLPIDWNSG